MDDAAFVEKLKSKGLDRLQKALELADPDDPDRPLVEEAVRQLSGSRTVAPTGERAAKLQRDIAASQSPLPGGQWAQPIDDALRYAGITGGEGDESTLGAIAHQANAGAASILSNVPGLMQVAEAIGDLSDALVPGQDPRHNVFPRSGGTNQLINTAPSPLLAHAAGITPWAQSGQALGVTQKYMPRVAEALQPGKQLVRPVEELAGKGSQAITRSTGVEGTAADAMQSLVAPIQKLAKNTIARPIADRLPGTILPSVATQVGLNTALNTAGAAGKALGGQPVDVVDDIVKPSLAPESLVPAAAIGAFPAPRGQPRNEPQRQAEVVADVRRANGGKIPSELQQPMATFEAKATEQRRSFADKFAQARQQAGDAWKARKQQQADTNKSSIDEAKKSADEAIATAAAEQELPARELYTQEKEAWSGKAGKGGEYRSQLDQITAKGERGESDTVGASLRRLAAKYQPTSEPVSDMGPGPSPEARTLSLGRSVNSLVESILGHLGANPSLREYQNALREVDTAAERSKASPSAKQAMTELAAALRDDAYRQFPEYADLATKHKLQMQRQETANQALYGKDDPRIGEGASDANRFAGETSPGEADKVPMAATTKASRWLAGEGEDPSTAHAYKAFRDLGDGYKRILDTVQAVKDQARGYVRDVEGRADATASDLETRARRSERNIKSTQTERQRELDDSLDTTRDQIRAVDKAKFPSLTELAPAAASIGISQAYHGPHSGVMLAGGLVHGASKLAPYARAQAAYHTPDSLRLDPQFARSNVLPAVSGPLAFETSNPFDIGTNEQTAPVNAYMRRREEEKASAMEELVGKLVKAGKSEEEARRAAEAAFQ